MTRLGWWMLLGFVAVIAGFFALTRAGHGDGPAVATNANSSLGRAEKAGGGLVVPVEGVKVAQLADTWGQSRAGGDRAHQATDIMAPRGTAVLAAAAGTVEKIFESADGGHTVYVRRNDLQWQDYYAHLDTYAPGLAEGMKVAQAQRIGTVGSTGDADAQAPHLHYAINAMAGGDKWWQGKAVNPYPILAGGASAR